MFRLNRLSYYIIFCIIILSLTSCDNSSKEGASEDHNPEHWEVDYIRKVIYQHQGLEKYTSPVQITFVREMNSHIEELLEELPNETLEDNRWTQLYEEVLGIEIKYDWIESGHLYHQKYSVALTSGNLPDVVRVNSQQLRELSNAGLIQDLTTVYEEFATPWTKAVMSQEGDGPFETATLDGKLMGIPEVDSSIEKAQFIWIRTDWLDQLGLDPPETMEDVLSISKAFTEKDPNQSGEDDTYGLAITQHLWDPVMGVAGFMAGFDAFPTIWIENDDGELVFGGIQPEVKTALGALQEMYQDGQLDVEFGFKDGNKVIEQIANGEIGMLYGEQWSSFRVGVSRVDDPSAEWKAFPIVSNSNELAKIPLKYGSHTFLAVRKGYENPEAIIKLINLHLEKNWGGTEDYKNYYSTPHPVWQLSPVTPFPALKNLDAYRLLKVAHQSGSDSGLNPEARSIKFNIDQYVKNNNESGWGWEKTYGPTGAFSILEQYVQNDQLLYDQFVGPPSITMVEMKPIMDNLMHDTYVNIILGTPLYEFDQFVDNWNRMGGEKITEEVNQWYCEWVKDEN
ncbi:extracellular solute-binding protein [Bacillus alkalicellulosilyticus]|uniref:extracellular solute-binding protein n=1 Tax=Alkalihalobacterium alkalicellulosilyticum TaxID=1912214 RepID=UPI0009989EE0|nr:extracellular solute-binding protein [Bacillus alkalicellulosilyticus]